jgi:hypothetical protein
MEVSRRLVVAVAVWAMAALAFFGVLHVLDTLDLSVSKITRDTAVVADMPYWTGALSTLGLLAWAAAATACLIAGTTLRVVGGQPQQAGYLLALGALTLMLLMDDAYLVHEVVVPRYFGVPEEATLGLYLVAAAGVAYRWRRAILAGRPLLLGLSTVCLVGSYQLDVGIIHGNLIFEDFLKYVGIGTFLFYCVREAHLSLSQELAQQTMARSPAGRFGMGPSARPAEGDREKAEDPIGSSHPRH